MEIRAPGFECAGQAYLLDLIVFLSRLYSTTSESSTAGLLRFSEAVAWMEENYMRQASVAELSRRAAMSERHFLRMFRKTFETSPIEHLIRLRIRRSAELLQEDKYNITETAYKSGFSDSNYFSRQFRRIMGMSPRQFRGISR
jgi:AraC-like DNA-binding protein